MNLDVHLLPALKDNYIAVVHERSSGLVLIVDPSEPAPVLEFLQKKSWRASIVLNTHHHWDHVGGNMELQSRFGAPLFASALDGAKIDGVDRIVSDGERFAFGHEVVRVISIPGHTLGHTAFYFENAKIVFTGDTLFAMGCGRLFEGTPEQMWSSLQKIASLPDETQVFCGHEYTLANARFATFIEPDNARITERLALAQTFQVQNRPTLPTTIGLEKDTNPFLRAGLADMRWRLNLPEETSDSAVFARLRAMKDDF